MADSQGWDLNASEFLSIFFNVNLLFGVYVYFVIQRSVFLLPSDKPLRVE